MSAAQAGAAGVAVIFEVEMREGRSERYFDLAAGLREALDGVDGFLGVERFQSLTTPGRYLSLSLWRDESAVARWRADPAHAAAQAEGKGSIFSRYRIRVARVLREYGTDDHGAGHP